MLTAVVQVDAYSSRTCPYTSLAALHDSSSRFQGQGIRRSLDICHAHLQGMQKNEQDNDVRLAATTALFNALEFAHSNFNNDSERNYLMQASRHL